MACATEQFEVRYAPEFGEGGKTASVVGVFQDGLMSEDAWKTMEPSVAQALTREACEAWYGEKLASTAPELLGAFEKAARNEGVTDALLGGISRYARGTHVIAFQVWGRPPRRAVRSSGAKGTLIAHGGDERPARFLPSDSYGPRPMEVSATVFSVALKKTVAVVTLEYTGARREEAVTSFSRKLKEALPDTTCDGWNWASLNSRP